MYWRRNNGGRSYYSSNESVLKRVKRWIIDKKKTFSYTKPKMTASAGGRRDDYEYNARKKAASDEIDRILEKVKKGGYQSLTDEEKRKLFDASQR